MMISARITTALSTGKSAYRLKCLFCWTSCGQPIPIRKQPLRVLDAACGTGMHAVALAKEGMRVSGADISARDDPKSGTERAHRACGCRILKTPVLAALRDAFADSPSFPFDALICLGNSLPHLLTPAQLLQVAERYGCLPAPGWDAPAPEPQF